MTVTAPVAALQSESATIGKLVDRAQIDALELNGRNPVLLAGLGPGARGGTMASLTAFLSQGPGEFQRLPERGEPDHVRRRSSHPHAG